MSRAALLLAAAVFAAVTLADAVARFVADRPSADEWLKIESSIRAARTTEAGRKVLEELRLDGTEVSELDYAAQGVEFRVAVLSSWANASPVARQFFSRRPTRFVVVVDRRILDASSGALAPVLVHELAHVADRRAAPTVADGLAVTERRGYLAAVQTALELELRDELPPARAFEGPVGALVADLRQWIDIYQGRPKPSGRYGARFARDTSKVDGYRALNPGVRALVAHVAHRERLGLETGGFRADAGQTPYQRQLYARLEAEDDAFRARLQAQAAAREAEPPGRREASSGGGSRFAAPRVAPAPVAAAAAPQAPAAAYAAPVIERPAATIDLDDLLASRATTAAQDACRGSSWGLGMRWERARAERALRPRLAGVADPCVRAVLEQALTRETLADADWAALIPRPAAPRPSAPYNPCIDPGNSCLRRE